MGYLGRRIGLSQDKGDSTPGGADGAVGGGLLDLFASGYFERQGNVYNAPGGPKTGITATGGVISDYTDPGPGTVYRAHVFTSTGEFDVTDTGNFGGLIDYVIVAGGGGGSGGSPGSYTSGGVGVGGAGQFLTASDQSVSATTYPVSIGAGGTGS